MRFRSLLSAALSAALLPLCLAGAAAARDLTVISWGGNFQDAQRIAYFAAFTAATGIKIVDQAWDGGVGTLRARVQAAGDPGWDVVHAEVEELQVGCALGLFEPIDWSKIPEKEKAHPGRHLQQVRRRRDHLVSRRRLRR